MWQTAKVTRLKNHKAHKRVVCQICGKFKISNDNRVCVKCNRMLKEWSDILGQKIKELEAKLEQFTKLTE